MANAMVSAAFSVVGKALAPLTGSLLKNWAASVELGSNVDALELELLTVKTLLEHALGREIHNSGLEKLLVQLQELGYDAEDVLDELDYFRIQDELDGTSEAADKHAKSFAHNLALHAKAVGKQIICLPACLPCAATTPAAGANKGNHHRREANNGGGSKPRLNVSHAVGKCFPCSSSVQSPRDDDDYCPPPLMRNHTNDNDDDEPPKLTFNRVDASIRMQHIVGELQRIRGNVTSVITALGSNWSTVPNVAQSRPSTTSESIEAKLYGRDLTKNSIIHDITQGKHCGELLTVIPIVGIGGIGKTTLAQHVYHSDLVQQHFDVKVWKCVSLNFNPNKLIEEIKEYIPRVDGENNTSTAGELIGQRLKNKRFLLVLDDIWDCRTEDEWKRLLVPFKNSQVLGNIIIVTTRFPAQAQKMVQTIDHSIYLQGLEHKEFKELFLSIVFGNDHQSIKDHKFLLETGDKIVARLKGSPLAAKTIGSLLKTQLELPHWISVVESKEWERSDGKDGIMPALKLSYDYLPSHLQRCLSYCALFPQDYKFQQEELINFWIGLEVLHSLPGENKRVEDIGLSHLIELVNHGFFEKDGKKNGSDCYILHDLLHELAQKVSSHECLSIDSSQSQLSSLQVLPSIRHLSINIDNTSVKDRLAFKNCVEDFTTLDKRLKVEKIRTLMLFGEHHGCLVKVLGELFREAKALRVIFLSKASYDVEDLLHNFSNLIHLRYLRIQINNTLNSTRFPNKLICRFYHMIVIDVDRFLINPRYMSNLAKLRHFHDRGGSTIIPEVGKLESLQELRNFQVREEGPGFELRQIGRLVELHGSLCIDNLQNVQAMEEADAAKLIQKSHLHGLVLCWNSWQSPNNDSALQEHVLERLKPSSNLLKLSIRGNRGDTCPSWLGTDLSVKNLESLCLDSVAWKTFPPIGEFCLVNVSGEEIPSRMPEKRFENLRRLELVSLVRLKKWVVHAPHELFPFLKALVISSCPNLVELSFPHSPACCQQEMGACANWFPKLSSLTIEKCPLLSSFPTVLPWTNNTCSIHIAATGCFHRLFCGNVNFNPEYQLIIEGKYTPGSTFWNVLAFHNLSKLKEFYMVGCQPPPLHHLQMLTSLRKLTMSCSDNAFPFTEGESHFTYQFPVERLDINTWCASGKELTQLLTYFPKLSFLQLWDSKNITGLGVMGQQATATLGSSSSANKLDEQRDARTEEGLVALEAEGLLLLPPQLQELDFRYCPELVLLSNTVNCSKENGRTQGVGGLQGMSYLRKLCIEHCPNLLCSYSSPSLSSCFPFPNSLEDLSVSGRVGMLLPLSNLNSLTSLSIFGCEDLRGEGLLSLLAQSHLASLSVIGTPDFFVDSDPSRVHEQEPPSRSSRLQRLGIDDVAGVTATPICRLLVSSLTRLSICWDKVEHFTEQQAALLFTNSLEKIEFISCKKLQYLPARIHSLPNLKRLDLLDCEAIQVLTKDGLPSSLQELRISRCPQIQSLLKDGLPSSLQELTITDCPQIQSLPKDGLPSSLQISGISNCPAIRSLPKVNDLPSSLRKLDVRYCGSEELRKQCRKLIGVVPIIET